ncbi:N-6 DNA methylase [Streptomyces sp. NPDC059753]|uniref:N-6 DNA methylase n=1 Tax=Streptomyces sp. NPDC059753 TaxID=3346933 RepID=UPI003652DDC2
MLGAGSMFRGAAEAAIRKAMVEDVVVVCIVALFGQLSHVPRPRERRLRGGCA